MAILVIAETRGVTPDMHNGMLVAVGDALRKAPGFIAHLAGQHGEHWRVIEVWESKEAASRWFADHVHPNLPPGVKPHRTFHELHALVVAGRDG